MEKLTGTFRTKALPHSDFWLEKHIRQKLLLRDDRDVLILGIRWIYAGMHEPMMKGMILQLADQLRTTDLDTWQSQPIYTPLP